MDIKFSNFAKCVTQRTAINDLMDDLGVAVSNPSEELCFFGGGNPAKIEKMNEVWRREVEAIMAKEGGMEAMLCNYADPRGTKSFVKTIVDIFNERYGWGITERNVCVTQGGQAAFYTLFNVLAGEFSDGKRREILFPIAPEYVGYSCQSVTGPIFRAKKPEIEYIGERQFKYKVDFSQLDIRPETAAICVSRPTNPTGNVLTDDEVNQLADKAEEHGIPLIVDNAYGAPFPSMLFAEANTIYRKNIVLTMSMSKIGLPGVRTAIVIGPESIIDAIVAHTTIYGLNNNNVGQAILEPLLKSGEIFELSESVIRPYYYEKAQLAQKILEEELGNDIPWKMHKCEGALFLWIWLQNLPISTQELYQRLRDEEIIVLPGEGFFFGLEEEWQHSHECVRISYAQDESTLRKGFSRMARVIKSIYAAQ